MHSCIYEGTVAHHRRDPVDHQFEYRLFMVYLDLDELAELMKGQRLFGGSKYGSRSFLRNDHLFEPRLPLADEIRNIIRQQTGQLSLGPIRLLTQLRHFGYYMSPLNVFYTFDECDRRVEYIVAEVNNTPWNERHCYVLWEGNREISSDEMRFSHPKQFHVSPFMGMDMKYCWAATEPGCQLRLQLANTCGSRQIFQAGMTLNRRELDKRQLRLMTLRYPLMTGQIAARIYFQASKLWWKKCPFHAHPKCLTKTMSPRPAPPPVPVKATKTGR